MKTTPCPQVSSLIVIWIVLIGVPLSVTPHGLRAESIPPEGIAGPGGATRRSDHALTVRDQVGTDEREREKTRTQLIEEVTRSWQRAGAYRARANAGASEAATAPVMGKLNGIVLPAVSFTRVPIGQAVAALSAASEEFDPADTGTKGVNMVLLDPSNRAPLVTLAGAFTGNSSSQQGSIVRPEGLTVSADGSGTITPALNLPIINHAPRLPGSTDLAAAADPLAKVAGVIGEFDVAAVVRALSQKQGTDLLSAPKVTVLSGNPATITVAQEMRFPQSFGQTQSQVGTGNASGGGSAGVAITAGTPQEFTTRNVGVELKVTPTVEDDGYSISLELNPRVTEFDGFVEYGGPSIAISGSTTVTVPSGFYQPIFSVRDISTKVTIWDGATLMMGGLTREEVKKVNDKVPVLGDIPLLGRLFRSKGQTIQKRNLIIFVRARLVNPGGAPSSRDGWQAPAVSSVQHPRVGATEEAESAD